MTVEVIIDEFVVDISEEVCGAGEKSEPYTVEISDGACVSVIGLPVESAAVVSGSVERTVIICDETVMVVDVAEQGLPGPAGVVVADLDRMTHPDYPDTRRVLGVSGGAITGVIVMAEGTEVFRREIVMADGRVTGVTTYDLIGNGRLIKTIGYDADGAITTIDREVSAWR